MSDDGSVRGKGEYVVKYELWPQDDPNEEELDENDLGRHTDVSIVFAGSETDAINAVLYDVRGTKSLFELSYVFDVAGPYESHDEAREEYDGF